MIDARTLPFNEQIYTFVDDDGSNVHIASARLREWCLAQGNKLEVFWTPVNMNMANKLLNDKTVDFGRVLDVKLNEPIIYAKSGTFTEGRPDVLLVDGHHRYCKAVISGKQVIESWVLEVEQWKPFQLTNLPPLTQKELSNVPILPRKYWDNKS